MRKSEEQGERVKTCVFSPLKVHFVFNTHLIYYLVLHLPKQMALYMLDT